jgi:hypothetical protein
MQPDGRSLLADKAEDLGQERYGPHIVQWRRQLVVGRPRPSSWRGAEAGYTAAAAPAVASPATKLQAPQLRTRAAARDASWGSSCVAPVVGSPW